jgi:predicted RecB family endonuclease
MDREDLESLESMKEIAGCFARIFESSDGERAIGHLKARFFVNDTTLAYSEQGRLDAQETAVREGQRSVVLYMIDLMDFDFAAANKLIEGLRRQPAGEDDAGV